MKTPRVVSMKFLCMVGDGPAHLDPQPFTPRRVEVVGENEQEAWLAKPLAARRPERSPQQEWDFVRGRVSYLLARGDQRRARRLMESLGMAPRTEARPRP